MEEQLYGNKKTNKKIERIVLVIYTIYMVAMLVTAVMTKWSIFAVETIFATTLAGWILYGTEFKDYVFRAKFIAVMTWVDFFIYAMHTQSFTSMLSTMTALMVMLGIFCISDIIYLGMIFSTVIILYHVFIAQTISVSSAIEIIRMLLHFFAVYVVSGIMLLMVRVRVETSRLLINNIRELETAEQSKDDFMVNVSHEIRTPINAVCGMSEAILQEDLPESVRRDVIDIQTAGRNLLSTVSNILDFSELESGKMELAEENYNITSTITDIINMALTLDNGKHLELIVDCDAELPSSLMGDEQKLRRIIMNLLDNAIKFTKEGGVILRVKARKEGYGINLVVSVRDSGIGMERTDMEKVFTSFSQVNSKRNREEGGVGLGLAITQALVRRMGGFITLKSTPGMGSEFKFTVPQRVLDETPIVSIKNKGHLFAVCYMNLDKYNFSLIRDGYEKCIRRIGEQLGIMLRTCRNLAELKRRIEYESYTHIFIGWEEYCEDRNYFEALAKEVTVVLILDYGLEIQPGSSMLRIYKPFTVLSIAAIFNGHKLVQNEEQHHAIHRRFIAPDARVLVVDDNAMNLKVMARLLLPYQIKMTMASSGHEALEKLDKMEFDCVFLDHMMPEMDGVETLHKIRQKGVRFQSLIVIAFTANAIGGAREMFMAEGFNDFIAKPIELSVLERMLRRYIPENKQIPVEDGMLSLHGEAPAMQGAPVAGGNPAFQGTSMETAVSAAQGVATAQGVSVPPEVTTAQGAEAPQGVSALQQVSDSQGMSGAAGMPVHGIKDPAPGQPDAKALADLKRAGIDMQQGMAFCGDEEGFREIAILYHQEGPKRQKKLQQFFRDRDWKNYVITVHALKSNSKGIGANELAELALNLEMAGKEGRTDYIFENHEELMDKHDALLKSLAANSFLYPEGYDDPALQKNAGISEGNKGNAETADSTEAEKQNAGSSAKLQPPAEELIAVLQEKLDSFESEGLGEILDKLAGYGSQEASLAEEIREKVDEFDFMGASEILSSFH